MNWRMHTLLIKKRGISMREGGSKVGASTLIRMLLHPHAQNAVALGIAQLPPEQEEEEDDRGGRRSSGTNPGFGGPGSRHSSQEDGLMLAGGEGEAGSSPPGGMRAVLHSTTSYSPGPGQQRGSLDGSPVGRGGGGMLKIGLPPPPMPMREPRVSIGGTVSWTFGGGVVMVWVRGV